MVPHTHLCETALSGDNLLTSGFTQLQVFENTGGAYADIAVHSTL